MTDRRRKKQALPSIALCLALIALVCGLSACGKKPGAIDPPPDVTEDHFPYAYPDPATDPKP